MRESSLQSPYSLLRAYLIPYVFLLLFYILIVGVGSYWLYTTARQAQTELVTSNVVKVVAPFIKQLHEQYLSTPGKEPLTLSKKVKHLFQAFPHLRALSVRDNKRGYGVRLSFKRQLVDVELEPLASTTAPTVSHQQLAQQLHHQKSPFFHILFNSTTSDGQPIQIDVAFDRPGLVGQINASLQSLTHSIIGFSILGMLSIVVAIAVGIYTAFLTQKMEARLQLIYHQASMGQLSASLVHDLRNPLASIRANVNNLLITPDETRQIIDEMNHDLLQLDQKLTDFLTLTKPRTSGFEAVDLVELVNHVCHKSEPLFKQHKIKLTVQINPDIPEITAIPEDLSNALLNLLVNAINHTPEQGHVWLKIQHIQNKLHITIEDNGAGIDESLLTKIFKPFFTTRDEGHGLGLAIVRKIVKAHGGIIYAENRHPSGARFVIELPLNND